MTKQEFFKQFNENYFSLLNFIKKYIGSNKKFDSFYLKNMMMKKTNIKYFIKSWYTYITIPHYMDISTKDVNYFLNKDYSEDKQNVSGEFVNSFEIIINSLREMYKKMDTEVITQFMEYIKSLTQLSYLYFKSN
jgi:hypothetical protein